MTRTICVLFLFLLFSAPVFAQSLRPPDAAEKAVLEKYKGIIDKVLDQFRGDDWDESVDYTLENPQVNTAADVPFDIDEMMQRTYNVRSGSSRYNALILPLRKKLEGTQDLASMKEIGAKAQSLMHVTVEVHFNRRVVGVDPPPASNQDLYIPGVAFAYKVKNDVAPHGTQYVLAFGNWKTARWDEAAGGYHFAFAHQGHAPVIENVEIRMYGADDRMQQLLHSINWNRVNDAITH